MSDTQEHPYSTLGRHLRYLREQQSESLAEVSGAVEIDQIELEQIEDGHARPAEDILMLLINHFNMQDQEAVQLWELAGYDQAAADERQRQEEIVHEALAGQKSVVLVMGMDSRTVYSDGLTINTNTAGVVLQFEQQNGHKQHHTIAKIGMSYQQAATALAQLQRALWLAEYHQKPKLLPPPTDVTTE